MSSEVRIQPARASQAVTEEWNHGGVPPPGRHRLTRFKKYLTCLVITFRNESSSPSQGARIALSPETSRETKTAVVGQRGPARLLAIYCPVKRRIKEKKGKTQPGEERREEERSGRGKKARRKQPRARTR